MQIITEEAVRQLIYKQKCTELVVAPEDFISTEANRYIREMGLKVVMTGAQTEKPAPEVNNDIHPVGLNGKKPSFTDAFTRQVYAEKPEHMNLATTKELVLAMVRAKATGQKQLVADLNELLVSARRILAAEVTGRPLEEQPFLGMDSAGLREASHNPQERFKRGHILPSEALSLTGATLNLFRARVREIELAAMVAFSRGDKIERPDIIKVLNRMSSACYVMMFFELAGRYSPSIKAEE